MAQYLYRVDKGDRRFVGLPDEWWHFSYGDQMWAKRTGAAAALYGMAKGPTP